MFPVSLSKTRFKQRQLREGERATSIRQRKGLRLRDSRPSGAVGKSRTLRNQTSSKRKQLRGKNQKRRRINQRQITVVHLHSVSRNYRRIIAV